MKEVWVEEGVFVTYEEEEEMLCKCCSLPYENCFCPCHKGKCTSQWEEKEKMFDKKITDGKEKNDEGTMEKTGVGTMARRPTFLKPDDTRGTDHIQRDDIQMPRIGIAQGLSPEVQEEDVKFIPNLKFAEMFNNLTSQIYGKGPIEFTIIKADRPRGVEFIPLKEGGGIRDFSVPLTDPRMQFGPPTEDHPNGTKPIATKFYDYIIMMIPSMEVVALSFKSTGLKTARRLNAFMKMKRAPSFAGKYTLTSSTDKNTSGVFGVYQVKVSDAVDEYTAPGMQGWVSEDVMKHAESIYESIKDKELDIEREQVEQEAEEGETKTENVPF